MDADARRVNSALRWLKVTKKSSRHTVAGASQPKARRRSRSMATACPNTRALSLADGRRGLQERNCLSKGFHSFIRRSFQTGSNLLQAVTVATRHSVGGKLQ